jgi:ferredoxin
MRVAVDRDICVSHGQCEFAAPDSFTINDSGDLEVNENPPESAREDVERAVAACPVRALTLVDQAGRVSPENDRSTVEGTELFLVVHALRLKGLAPDEHLADVTGLDPADLSVVLEQLIADELVKLRAGRIGGYTLTPAGRQSHASLLSSHVTPEERTGVGAAYDAFLPINGRFKETCTRWQMRTGEDGAQQVNDHSDAGYDAAVIDELGTVHKEAVEGLTPAASVSPRFGRYVPRFDRALDRLRDGEVAAFARPMSASYHDVWMELHEDFLLTLGRQREAADGH